MGHAIRVLEAVAARDLQRGDVIKVGIDHVHIDGAYPNAATDRAQLIGRFVDSDACCALTWPMDREFVTERAIP